MVTAVETQTKVTSGPPVYLPPPEPCGAIWRFFYCVLPKGHEGPHEDDGSSLWGPTQTDQRVNYDIFWTVEGE